MQQAGYGTNDYDFPVQLQKVFTMDHKEVPRVRAVVRQDINEPIATVSDRYHLIPHREVLKEAESFISSFGTPTSKFSTGKNGATLVGEYTYMEVTKKVKHNDVVGLRVYIENSYNASMSLRFRIGALRLTCLNGMVGATDLFDLRFRHTKGQEISFPTHEQVSLAFATGIKGWAEFAKLDLSESEYKGFAEKLVQQGLLPLSYFDKHYYSQEMEDQSVWGLYNTATSFVTHKSQAQEIGKVNRLGRIDQWFNDIFIKKAESEEALVQ